MREGSEERKREREATLREEERDEERKRDGEREVNPIQISRAFFLTYPVWSLCSFFTLTVHKKKVSEALLTF